MMIIIITLNEMSIYYDRDVDHDDSINVAAAVFLSNEKVIIQYRIICLFAFVHSSVHFFLFLFCCMKRM